MQLATGGDGGPTGARAGGAASGGNAEAMPATAVRVLQAAAKREWAAQRQIRQHLTSHVDGQMACVQQALDVQLATAVAARSSAPMHPSMRNWRPNKRRSQPSGSS